MSNLVLVLNANYEPVNVCSLRRAVGLILQDKAILVMNGRGEIHTIGRSYPRPSIIRLSSMIHRPRLRVKFNRREVFRRDHFTCQYCGRQSSHLTIDHIKPRHMGGEQTWENVVAACPACNHRKGGRTVEESGMKLVRPPKEPPTSATYVLGRHLVENGEWEQFLAGW